MIIIFSMDSLEFTFNQILTTNENETSELYVFVIFTEETGWVFSGKPSQKILTNFFSSQNSENIY